MFPAAPCCSATMCASLRQAASGQREDASVLIFTPDHLIFSNNHCWLDSSRFSAFVDALLVAGSLNVVGNRFQEAPDSVFFSGLTAGLVNITGQNISTYCLIVLGAIAVRITTTSLSSAGTAPILRGIGESCSL